MARLEAALRQLDTHQSAAAALNISMRFYSAADLAGLPGMPLHASSVWNKAQREAWPFEVRELPTGPCRFYPITALPLETQAELRRRNGIADSERIHAAEVTDKKRERARERAALVRVSLELIAQGTPSREADALAAEGTEHSARSVMRWRLAVQDHPVSDWTALLLDGRKGGQRRVELNEEAWAILKSDYLRGSKPAFRACYERLKVIARKRGWELPNVVTLRRRLLAEVPRTVRTLKREGEKALEQMYPAQKRDRASFQALEALNADGHRLDILVRWPDGSVERPIMLGFQDLASNKILSWRIDRTENADLIRLTVGDLIEQWGIPDHIYFDNGRAFASKWLTGHTPTRFRGKIRDEDPVGVLVQLGIQVHWTTPYHGQSKPIERAWRDLCEYLSRHPAFEGAYLGSDTTKKPHNVGTRTIELADFLRVADVVIREHNAREDRRSSVAQGRSFDDVFRSSYEKRTIRRLTDAQRRLLMLAVDAVNIRSTGEIHLWGNRYWSAELAHLETKRVSVRFDPQALHAGIYVYRLDGSYVGFCECIDAVGFASRDAGRDHARKRRAFTKAAKEAAKGSMDPSELAAMHMRAAGARERIAPAVVAPQFGLPSAEPITKVQVKRTEQELTQSKAQRAWIVQLGQEAKKVLRRKVG